MKRFRFRAAPALELRRRQEELARNALSVAQAAERGAADAVSTAHDALDGAVTGALTVEAAAPADGTASWHRNWITGQRHELTHAKDQLQNREAETLAATDSAQAARRRLRSLERLRDRVWSAHQHELSRLERRDLDLLANLRYIARRRSEGGTE